jgi:release factor glutamine methyltransferase
MPNVSEILKTAAEILQASGINEPRREANSLLAFALGKDKTFLIAHSDYKLSGEEEKRFLESLRRRANREPLQYITGRQEFYGLDFTVTPDVLIPRPETELIVENAIEILRDTRSPVFCEVGTGSGCISVSILHEVKAAKAVSLDISAEALKIAALNAARHRVSDRIELKVSDVFSIFTNEKFDLIASNPPYIPFGEIENLQPEVRDFEPLTALTDDKDGLSIIEKIINESPRFLKSGGYLLMEIGFGQSEKAREYFAPDKWENVEFLFDLQNIPRTIKAKTIEKL